MTYDYGNARVAGMRSRLLGPADLQQLAHAPGSSEFVAALGRFDDWRPILRDVAPLGAEAEDSLEAAIERHRGERLGLLPRLYEGSARRLVEALVMGLDQERVLAVFRRRRALLPDGAIEATTPRGALLDTAVLGRVTRATASTAAIGVVTSAGLVDRVDGTALVQALEQGTGEAFETSLVAACDRARDRRARGRGAQHELVRSALARERADRVAVAGELRDRGPLGATLLERAMALARFDQLARRGRRDPLGIGVVMGYVAAIEVQAIRLRAVFAHARGAWPAEGLEPYLGPSAGT